MFGAMKMKWNVLTHTSEPSNPVLMKWFTGHMKLIRFGIYINDTFYPMGEPELPIKYLMSCNAQYINVNEIQEPES